MVLLEICANSIQSALYAQEGGADRIELCENLEQGGTTPSYGLIKACKAKLDIPVHVLIRPRVGDFMYNEDEFKIMLEDVLVCRELKCEGVVLGILDEQFNVDVERCKRLVAAAAPMQVTFHRAYDDTIDKREAFKQVMSTGCTRLLTSGHEDSAKEGLLWIQHLVSMADERITIIPGAGINPQNVQDVVRQTQVTEIHASAKRTISATGTNLSKFSAVRFETDPKTVRELVAAINKI